MEPSDLIVRHRILNPRDPRRHPEIGDTATNPRTRTEVRVVSILRHLHSTDIAYIRVRSIKSGRERSLIWGEWYSLTNHRAPEEPHATP